MFKNKNFQKAFAVLSAAAFLGSIGGNVEAMKGKGKKPGAHSKLSLEDKQKKKEEVDKKRKEAAERKEKEERIRQAKLLEEQKAEYEAKKPEREAEKAKIEAEKAKIEAEKAKIKAEKVEQKAKAEAERKAKAEAKQKAKEELIGQRDEIIKRNKNVFAIELDEKKGFNITFKCEVLTSEIMNDALSACSIWNGERKKLSRLVINEINIKDAKEIKQMRIQERKDWICVNKINIISEGNEGNIVFDDANLKSEDQGGGIFDYLLPHTINIKCSGDVSIGKHNFTLLYTEQESYEIQEFRKSEKGEICSLSNLLEEYQKTYKIKKLVSFTKLNICVDGNLNIKESAFSYNLFLFDCNINCKKTLTIKANAFYNCFTFASDKKNIFKGNEIRISRNIFVDTAPEYFFWNGEEAGCSDEIETYFPSDNPVEFLD